MTGDWLTGLERPDVLWVLARVACGGVVAAVAAYFVDRHFPDADDTARGYSVMAGLILGFVIAGLVLAVLAGVAVFLGARRMGLGAGGGDAGPSGPPPSFGVDFRHDYEREVAETRERARKLGISSEALAEQEEFLRRKYGG